MKQEQMQLKTIALDILINYSKYTVKKGILLLQQKRLS